MDYFYNNIHGLGVAQSIGFRVENVVDATAQSTIEATGNNGGALGSGNIGYPIYRLDLKRLGLWDGTQFVFQEIQLSGDIIFQGAYDASLAIDDPGQPNTINPVAGNQYVVTTAGTFNPGATGVTLNGNQNLNVGDQIVFVSATEAYTIDRNTVSATQTIEGTVFLADQTEVDSGISSSANTAVTPETLQQKLVTQGYTKQFSTTLNLTGANNPDTINHGLNLLNRDAFTINVMRGNSQISVDVDSIDVNNLTLTSLLPITGVRVTIIGAAAA